MKSILQNAVANACPRCLAGIWLLWIAVLAAGCVTEDDSPRQVFERRAAKCPLFPAEARERLQRGEVLPGDTQEMVWVARGDPGRKSSRLAAGQTNELWTYFEPGHATDAASRSYSSSWHPTILAGGRMVYVRDPVWVAEGPARAVEVLRVEFASNRVVSVEAPNPSNKPQP